MVEENLSQEFRSKNIDEARNYFPKEIEQNELITIKQKKVCTALNYIEHFFTLASIISGCISIYAFTSLIGILIEITSSAIRLKIKKLRSIINKKKKKHDKIVLLAKSKLNSIEVLISKALIDSVISHEEFVLIDNVVKEYGEMKEEIKNLKT